MSYGKGDFGKNPPPVWIPPTVASPSRPWWLLFLLIPLAGLTAYFVFRTTSTVAIPMGGETVSVPDSGSTLVMLGIGVGVLIWRRL